MTIITHNKEAYPISKEYYQGILTLSTVANGQLFKRRYFYYSEHGALKCFKRDLKRELTK